MTNNMEAFTNDYNVLIKTNVIDNERNQTYLGVYKNVQFTEGERKQLNFFKVTV